MRLEELSDKSLFKILKVIYNDIDKLDDLYGDDYYSDNDTVSKIKEVLKNLGIKSEFLNIQYIYVCLRDNWSILDKDTLTSSINRPQLKKYDVDIDVRIYKTCTESYTHKISSYDTKDSVGQLVDYMSTNDNFYPTDGRLYDENCDHYETESWEVIDVSES